MQYTLELLFPLIGGGLFFHSRRLLGNILARCKFLWLCRCAPRLQLLQHLSRQQPYGRKVVDLSRRQLQPIVLIEHPHPFNAHDRIQPHLHEGLVRIHFADIQVQRIRERAGQLSLHAFQR